MKATKALAEKVLKTVDAGLCKGTGRPMLGEMCIISAKRFACGLPHGDQITGLPIGAAVRLFEIGLNDCNWSSNSARAKGMRALSVAEWGSDEIDQKKFSELLALKTIQRIVPKALRAAANCKRQTKEWRLKLEIEAVKCAAVVDLKSATAASHAASAAASSASAASHAASAASHAASAAASGASYASHAASAASHAASAASHAASAAASGASYASYAASHAAIAASHAAANKDEFLIDIAGIAVEVLTELQCEGCKWLDIL